MPTANEAATGANGADDARLETKRRQMREAQRRYYDKHKRKKSPDNPCPSYCPERIQAIKREYYAQHRDEIIARSKKRYQDKKALAGIEGSSSVLAGAAAPC